MAVGTGLAAGDCLAAGIGPAAESGGVAGLAAAVLAAPARLGGVRLVAVDGPSGAGKSTVAAALAAHLAAALAGHPAGPEHPAGAEPSAGAEPLAGAEHRAGADYLTGADHPAGVEHLAGVGRVVVLPTDHFATWDDPVSWWPRLVDGVLAPLRAGQPGTYRRTDWVGGVPAPGPWLTVPAPTVLIIEGVSAGRRSVRPWLSTLVWVDLPDETRRLDRAVARDGPASRPALAAWQRFERGWFAVDGTRAAADRHMAAPGPGGGVL